MRSEQWGAEYGCHLADLLDGITRGGRVAGREHDLDVGTEPAGPRHRVLRLVEGPLDHPGRGLVLPLGESEQREARLWIVAVFAGVKIRSLRRIEVADEAQQIALDRERSTERRRVDGCSEPIARVPRLHKRFGPRTEQLEDLGAVKKAMTAVQDELLLRVTPADERVGPGSAAFEVEELRAGIDHGAVRVAGSKG